MSANGPQTRRGSRFAPSLILRPNRWALSTRLVALCILIGIGSIGLVSTLTYRELHQTLISEGTDHLESIRSNRKKSVETHLIGSIHGEIATFSENLMTVEAVKAFKQG